MTLEEAVGRLRKAAHDQIQIMQHRVSKTGCPKVERRLLDRISKLETARDVAYEFLDLIRDRGYDDEDLY